MAAIVSFFAAINWKEKPMEMDTSDAPSIMLMGHDRVKRSIDRMAYQITEDNGEEHNILVLGIKRRGYVVAKLLAGRLATLSAKRVEIRPLVPEDNKHEFKDLTDTFGYIVIVDDVIFSGSTMFKALSMVVSGIDTLKVRTAVLVDRGHRSVPVEATFVGLPLPTKLKEHVRVVTGDNTIKKVVLNHSSV